MNDIKAQHWFKMDDTKVHCVLCPHDCRIPEGKKGVCGVRVNRGGELYADSYGQVSSLALDPIEKKPLYHFHPGMLILSVGSFGCNLSCSFCQNHSISMDRPQTAYISPESLVYKAYDLSASKNIGLAYTYNEPLISFEYVLDCCKLAREKGLKNVLVTNGYIQQEPLKQILPYVDAMNIDLKGFHQAFYKEICGGRVEFVKKTVESAVPVCHVEVTTLIIPGENDSEDEINALSGWLASMNPDIPLHLSRFFPRYKMSHKEPTPVETIRKLVAKAGENLRHVHAGNI